MEKKFVNKTFNFEVSGEGLYNRRFELDRNIALVHGVYMSADNPKLLFFRGSQRIEINGTEIFPEGYESKTLMTGLDVAPEERFRTLGSGVIAGSGEIKVIYQDMPHPEALSSSYMVSVTFKCELK